MSGKRFLLDSNCIINLIDGRIDAEFVPSECAVSVITVIEVLGFSFPDQHVESLTRKFIELFQILYIDEQCASKVIELRKIRKIKLPDAIIASTAIVHNLELCSNDQHLCSIEGVQSRSFLLK